MKQETLKLPTGEVKKETFNGHDALLLTVPSGMGSSGATQKSIIVWYSGNLLIVVDGPAGYNAIKTLAEASGL
jgi:hypothetical protein